jgi:putative aldouronate transport system substrate-binding protein
MRDLYKEGLLDPEFAMMSNTTIQEKMSSGRTATLILNGTAPWWKGMETPLLAYKPDAKMGALSAWPAGPAGEVRMGGSNFFGTVLISSKATEEEIVRALAFMDWTLTEECYDLFYWGIEGKQYNVVNGVRVLDDAAKQAITFGRDLYLFYDLINNVSQYKALTIQPLIDNKNWLANHVVFDEVVGLSNDVTVEIGSAIDDVYNTWMVDFITGAKDIDTQWNDYLAEMESAGLSRYLAEVDTYMAKKRMSQRGCSLGAAPILKGEIEYWLPGLIAITWNP